MYRYAAPQRGRYREHWQLSVEAIGSDDPAVDAEVIQLYDTLLGSLGVTEYTLAAELDRRPQLPPAVRRASCARWLDEHEARARRGHAQEARRRARSARSTTSSRSRRTCRRCCARRRRSATSLCDECRAHFAAVREALDAYGVALRARPDARPRARLLHAHDLGVRRAGGHGAERDLRRRPLRLPRRGDRRPADARRRLRRRHRAARCSRWKAPARPRTRRGSTSSSCSTAASRAAALRLALATLRAAGLAADTDYAGRSLKGQLTQASALGRALDRVVLDADGRARARERGAEDRTVELSGLADTLGVMSWRDLHVRRGPRRSTSASA